MLTLLFSNLYCMKQTYQQGDVKWKEHNPIIFKIKFYYQISKEVVIFSHNNFKSKLFSKGNWY